MNRRTQGSDAQLPLAYAPRDLRTRRYLRPRTLVALTIANLLLAVLLVCFDPLARGLYYPACDWLGVPPAVDEMTLRDLARLLTHLSSIGTLTVLGVAIFHPHVPLAVSLACSGASVVTMVLWLFAGHV